MEQTSIPRWQSVTGWVLSGILALVFLPSAFFKIAQPKGFIEEWSKTYPAGSALPLGVIELTLFVLYLVPKTRYLGGLAHARLPGRRGGDPRPRQGRHVLRAGHRRRHRVARAVPPRPQAPRLVPTVDE